MKNAVNIFKIVISIAMISGLQQTQAQTFINLQLHKEMGSFKVNDATKVERNGFRAKFEMLGNDSLGTYYWNTQALYGSDDKTVNAQVQIIRGFKLSKHTKLQALIGHQGAVGTTSQYLVGLFYPLQVGRVRLLPFASYVYNKDQQSADFRVTSGYGANLCKNKILIFGFINGYTKDKLISDGEYEKEIGFQANPQVWLRFNKQLAIGSEVNVDYLESRYQDWIIIPTAAFRWVFYSQVPAQK